MLRFLAVLVVLALAWLLAWPTPIAPARWQAPDDPGYTGAYATNARLAALERVPLGEDAGPEDVAVDDSGRVYASTGSGFIVRVLPGGRVERWVHTRGRPLGIDFDAAGNLIVADALRGLLLVTRDGTVSELATHADGFPLGLTDDVDVAPDGRIWFTDATTRFSAREYGLEHGTLLDIMEHGGHGRLLVHDPRTGVTRTVLPGLQYANGVAVSHDGKSVLVAETGAYRVIRVPTDSASRVEPQVVIDNLPGFPDNVSQGRDGRYWIALVAPRNALLDRLAPHPTLRRMVQRLPAALRPSAGSYGHVVAIDEAGRVVVDLQDPAGAHPQVTSVTETGTHLWLGSLVAPALGRLPRQAAGLSGGP